MNRRRLMQKMIMMGGKTPYTTNIINTGPIAYWPLNETAGATAKNYGSMVAGDGAYTAVTLANTPAPGGGSAPLFDGATSYCDIYSVALNAAFNGNLGSIALWCKVLNIGVWTDDTYRRAINLLVDGNSNMYLDKSGAAGANVERAVSITPLVGGQVIGPAASVTNSIAWVHLAITWSDAANSGILYANGAQDGATLAAYGTWNGDLAANGNCIGAGNTTPDTVWSGWIAHVAIWNRVLSPTEILALYNGGL